MKRRNDSTALSTNAGQPGDDDARALENVAGDHVGTPPDNTKDVLQAIPLDASLAPALPAYARLTDEHVAAARQTGQWLEAFVAFASIASPLTPPYRRRNSGHKPVLAHRVNLNFFFKDNH